MTADPALGSYLSGSVGGPYVSSNLALYGYGRNNPATLRDPNGRVVPLIALVWALVASAGGGAAVGGAVYVGRERYVHGNFEGVTAGGLGESMAWGAGAGVALYAAPATATVGFTGLAAYNLGPRLYNYSDTSPEEQRAIQFDTIAAGFGVVAGVRVAAGRVTPAAAAERSSGDLNALFDAAVARADAARTAGATRGVAAAFRGEGEIVTDVSSGAARQTGQTPTPLHPELEGLIGTFRQNSPYPGRCGEIGCLSQELWAGRNIWGGTATTAKIRGASNPEHGMPEAPCITCSQVFRHYGITYGENPR
jgi:hypothetical protein